MGKEREVSEAEFRALMQKYQLEFVGNGHTEPEYQKGGLNNLFKARGGERPKDDTEARELTQIAEYAATALVSPRVLREWQDSVISWMIKSGEEKVPVYCWRYQEPMYRSHPRWEEAKQYVTFWEDKKSWEDVRYGKLNEWDKQKQK